MMALIGALVFALLVAPAMKGRLSSLSGVRFRYEFLLPIGLLLQVVPRQVFSYLERGDIGAIALFSWLAGGFVLLLACLLNWKYVGCRLVALGVALNGLTIVLNRGMPVAADSLEYLGLTQTDQQLDALTPLYHLSDGDTLLGVLGDVIPVPGPQLVQSVVSLGDLLLMVGIVVIVLDGANALLRVRAS